MRRRNYCQPRSRSACCPPGCSLPCCMPRRRRCPKPNTCIFIPPPALSTKRYCGDPCSPPPPGCTPRPAFGRNSCRPRRPRASLCCDPCEPRPRPLSSCSPRTFSRPFRPFSSLFSSTNPCRPKKCGPLDPCVPSLTDRCDPCLPRSLCDPCLPSTGRCPSPCCYKGNKGKRPCRPRRRSVSPKCRPGRSTSRRSSSCGSSYCESSYSRRAGSGRCQVCECDPCCCSNKGKGNCHEAQVKCPANEDTSKGPTSWFLKKSEKCGKNKSPKEPHFCPWEAEVTVTGTVRGHCTSTAVEVAKRLTGKFSSRGQRYICKKGAKSSDTTKDKCRPQRMAMGYLDDGTKLDFSRNRCEEDDEDAVHNRETYIKGRTNNANNEATACANRWNSYWDDLRFKERKYSGRGDLDFPTAYIGRRSNEAEGYINIEENNQDDDAYTLNYRGYSGAPELADHRSRHGHRNRHKQNRARIYQVASDSDQSSYKTASESVQCSRWYPSFSRDPENVLYARRKGCRKNADLYTDTSRLPSNSNSNGRREAWWRQHNYHRTRLDDNSCYDDEDAENDVINFNLVSDDDCNNGDNENDNDDIDKVNPHPSPPPRRLAMDRRVRSSDRRHLSTVSHSRRSTQSRVPRTHRHHSRASGSAKHMPDSAYLDLDDSTGQSSDGGLREGRSSNSFYYKTRHRQKCEATHQPKYLHHRKKVSYGAGL